MKPPNDERLMRYFDRELDDAEAGEVEEWLAGSAEARALLARLERVGDTVRSIGDDLGAGADGIADAVMGQLDAQGEPPAIARSPAAGARAASAQSRAARRWLARIPALGLGRTEPRPSRSISARIPRRRSVMSARPSPGRSRSRSHPIRWPPRSSRRAIPAPARPSNPSTSARSRGRYSWFRAGRARTRLKPPSFG